MGLIQWATSPWGREVPIHIAFGLLWVSAIGGLLFLVVHAIYVGYWAKSAEGHGSETAGISPAAAARIPARAGRHSFGGRLFPRIMARALRALLFTALVLQLG